VVVPVGVAVGVAVPVGVAVAVSVLVAVGVAVDEAVAVAVPVRVLVAVAVLVVVAVAENHVSEQWLAAARRDNGALCITRRDNRWSSRLTESIFSCITTALRWYS